MAGKSAQDLEIAAFADAQHGVVSRAQLLQAGLTRNEIDHRIAARRLRRVHQGVYAVGHKRLRVEGRWMAAVLACGKGAVLSHQTAAAAWELRRVGSGAIHISVPGDAGRKRRAGIKLHRSTTLTPDDVAHRQGIPVTTVARTIIDLARTTAPDELERIVDLADQGGLVDFADLRQANSASLQAVLRAYAPAPTRSELERAFLRICDKHGLPRPEVNQIVEGFLVDFVWRDRRLIVEVDGYAYHRAPSRFETDRERDAELGARGWRVRRFTWRQHEQRPAWVAAMTKRA
jgi:very-short-patch-repair endonuclease/predicted transcriptional regulator of viral defense system